MRKLHPSAETAMYTERFHSWHLYRALAFSLRLPRCGI